MGETVDSGPEQNDALTPEKKEQIIDEINWEVTTQGVHPDGLYFDFLSRGEDEFSVGPPAIDNLDEYSEEMRYSHHFFSLNQPILVLSFLREPRNNFKELIKNDRAIGHDCRGSLSDRERNLMIQSRYDIFEKVGKEVTEVKQLLAMSREEYVQWLISEGLASESRDIPKRENIEGADVFHRAMEIIRSIDEDIFNQGKLYCSGYRSSSSFSIGVHMPTEPVVYQTKKGLKIIEASLWAQFLEMGGNGQISIRDNAESYPELSVRYTPDLGPDSPDYLTQIKRNWEEVNEKWPEKLREYFDI